MGNIPRVFSVFCWYVRIRRGRDGMRTLKCYFYTGLWSAGGIWELKTPSALKQAEILEPHTSKKRVVDYEDKLPRYTEMYNFPLSLSRSSPY
jgi:hypothetical protein